LVPELQYFAGIRSPDFLDWCFCDLPRDRGV
jgi:hypothetical protein